MLEMTVVDMMNVIARTTKNLNNAVDGNERKAALENARAISQLSRQFFSAVDCAIRSEKIQEKEKTLGASQMSKIIGEA